MAGIVPAASANNYTVTADGDPGNGGLSLRQAVTLAMTSPNSVIDFDPSLVGSTITLTQGAIGITKAVAILGPGPDKIAISGDAKSGIFVVDYGAASPPVTISGLTLTNAYTPAGSDAGAVYSAHTSLVLENSVISGSKGVNVSALIINGGNIPYYARLDNVTIENNVSTTTGHGSAVFLEAVFKDAHLTVLMQNCRIIGNTGSGIYSEKYADLTITGSTISGNTGLRGGGIYSKYEPNINIADSTISGNTAIKGGGGVFMNDSAASVQNTQITGNFTYADGGGFLVTGSNSKAYSSLTLTDSTVSNNEAYDFGAGIDVKRAATLTIERSLVSGNQLSDFTTGANGGGVALQYLSGQTQIDNSTFYRNFAYNSGGGIGIFNATTANNTKITNATIVGNSTAYFLGNGISSVGKPYIGSSILAGNASRLYAQDIVGNFEMKYSLLQNQGSATITGVFNIGGDPQLGPLATNGGRTMTLLPAETSPVLNVGNPFINSGLDQRGVTRVFGGVADMGAVERQVPEVMIMRNGFD